VKILVIGGTGFIGPSLLQQLAGSNHELAVFHRTSSGHSFSSALRQILGDRRRLRESRSPIREFGPDVVIDLILSSGSQAEELMREMRGIARRVIAISSMDVYRACGVFHGSESGDLQELPLTEDSQLRSVAQTYPPEALQRLQSVFGWLDEHYDKIPVERAILSMPGELPGTVLRLPMIYGPGDRLHRLFPIVKRILEGRTKIVLWDELARWRGPKGYVENVANAIALAATSELATGRVYNIAEEEAMTELSWAELIAREMNWKGEFVLLPRERTPKHLLMPGNFAQHWIADSSRIRDDLGYREIVGRTEAVRRTVEWESCHPPEPFPNAQFNYEEEDAACGGGSTGSS
jgi:nucleoside-diphosphate-sugar epimerase